MTPAALATIVSLVQSVMAAAEALKAISAKIKERQAAGQDITLDDLKELQLPDDLARQKLVEAIEAAENA